MRILQVTFSYLPESIGGTEIYVAGLAAELVRAGHEVLVAVARAGEASEGMVEGIPVRWVPPDKFREALREWRPEVVHFHPLTGGDLLPWMNAAREHGKPIVGTYHTATLTCGRGDLLQFGKDVCDGLVDAGRCARCVLHERGVPAWLCETIRQLSTMPVPLPPWMPRKVKSMMDIARQRKGGQEAWEQVRDCVDHWVAASNWAAGVLKINGVPPGRISVNRQGVVDERLSGSDSSPPSGNRGSLIVGYLGRLHPHKGIESLLDAARHISDPNVEIRIAGSGAPEYEMAIRRRCRDDPRVRWMGRVVHHSVAAFLRGLDVLVVPSIGMETGPMTILESWAAGTPVIGSARGGIAEWISECGGGLEVPPGDADSLAQLLNAIIGGEVLLPHVPARPRTMSDVGSEMQSLYTKMRVAHGS